MAGRIAKWIALMIGGFAALILLAVGAGLVSEHLAYQRVEITTALLRDGRYDPAQHFKFDRACVFPPESGMAYTLFLSRGYRELDKIFPDTFTNWTLVLIDDTQKTLRTLYVLEPLIKFGGIVCNPKITLRTKTSNGDTVAEVEEATTN